MPSSIVKQKTDIVHAKPFDIVEAEPRTPEIHLKVGHVEDPQESLKARSTGFKVNYFELITHSQYCTISFGDKSFILLSSQKQKSLAKECLSFINSASK